MITLTTKNRILKNHTILENNIGTIIRFSKIFFNNFELTDPEKALVVEGLLLKACAFWERFLEKEIVHLVSLDATKLIKEVELSNETKLNSKIIRAILFSNNYIDLHDIERSKNFFRRYIVSEYNYFDGLQKDLIKKVDLIYKLRNYIVHNSEYSKKQLNKFYNDQLDYKNFIEPGKYLIKEKGKVFSNLIHNFSLLSASMRGKLQ